MRSVNSEMLTSMVGSVNSAKVGNSLRFAVSVRGGGCGVLNGAARYEDR